MTLEEIAKILKGYSEKETRIMQRQWEIARWQVMHFIAPYSKKKIIRASDIAVFEWEKNKVKQPKPDREAVIDKVEQWQRWEEKNK